MKFVVSPHYRAVLFAVVGFTLWVFVDACFKLVGETNIPGHVFITIMSASALVTMGIVFALRNKLGNLRIQKPHRLLVLGIILSTNIFTTLLAFKHLTFANIYPISFMGPVLTALLAPMLLKERVLKQQILAVLAGFVGVLITIDPLHAAQDGNRLGYIAAFGILGLTTANMLLLRFYGPGETHESLSFYPRLFAFVSGVLACSFLTFEWPPLGQLWPIVAAGCLAGLGWLFVTIACQIAPASTIAPIRYTQIVTGAALGYFVWHDRLQWNTPVGVTVIILSSILGIKYADEPIRTTQESTP